MEYFGLKDKNGKDVKLVVTDDPFVHPHPIIRVESIEPVRVCYQKWKNKTHKSEFKVGDWVCDKTDSSFLKRITTLQDDAFCADGIDNALYLNLDRDWRLATPQEIEAHLRKICDEKYAGRVIKTDEDVYVIKRFLEYNSSEDSLWYWASDNLPVCIYREGKFAEIVPDEPKELPKTVGELVLLIQDIFIDHPKGYDIRLSLWIEAWLAGRGYKTT